MSGDDTIRFCPKCQLNVYNFAEMTEAKVNQLLIEREGKVCAKIYQRASGSLVTKDSPVAFRILPLLPGITDKLQPQTVDHLIRERQQIFPEPRPLPPSHPAETGITLLAYDPMGSAAADTPFLYPKPQDSFSKHSAHRPDRETAVHRHPRRILFTQLCSWKSRNAYSDHRST
jgi:hypothetical protein